MSSTVTKRWRTRKVGFLTQTSVGDKKKKSTHPSAVIARIHTHMLTLNPLFCQALRSGYEEEEAGLPKLEDLQGAAKGLMRLQDVYALQVASLAKGRFQRVTDGKPTDVCLPTVSIPLSGDDCFLVGKVHKSCVVLFIQCKGLPFKHIHGTQSALQWPIIHPFTHTLIRAAECRALPTSSAGSNLGRSVFPKDKQVVECDLNRHSCPRYLIEPGYLIDSPNAGSCLQEPFARASYCNLHLVHK